MTESLDHRFTKFLLEAQALKFGEFTLKSGRKSPYFINAGAFNDGRKIATLGAFYAEKIAAEIEAGNLPNDIDTIFGPAYKGIPLGVSTALALTSGHGMEVVGLVLSVDRMEKTKDSDTSAVKAVEAEFGFPVFAIANVREIFEAGQHIETADGTAYVTDEIKAAADAYLEQYGA